MSDIAPFIRYRDARRAIAWLKDAFGFESLFVVDGEGDGVGHAQLRAGDGVIMVSTLRDDALRMTVPGPDGHSTVGIYMTIDDPDAHFARARAAGAAVIHEPMDQDYGGRDYTVRDPEGHIWSFGSYRPGHG